MNAADVAVHLARESRRVVRHFQRYTSEQRADRAASHRLGPRQRQAVGEFFYTHPALPLRAFDTRMRAARASLAALWQGLSGPFTCTGCGTRVVYDSGGPEQTLDGSRKLCTRCSRARHAAARAALPAGVYAVNVRDGVTGEILTTTLTKLDAS